MLVNKLESLLTYRVQLIEKLVLLSSYSELLVVNIDSYKKQSQSQYQKQHIIMETYKNFYRVDELFRKVFYHLCCKIFRKMSKKFHPLIKNEKTIGRIHAIYFDFINFFKIMKENHMLQYITQIELDYYSQTGLVGLFTEILIKYLKIKTELVIVKIESTLKKSEHNFNIIDFPSQQNQSTLMSIKKIDNSKEKVSRRVHSVKNSNSGRYFSSNQKTAQRFSQSKAFKKVQTHRIMIASKKPILQIPTKRSLEKRDLSSPTKSQNCYSINYKHLKLFKQIYSNQWNNYLENIDDLLQLDNYEKKNPSFENNYRKKWLRDNMGKLIKQMHIKNEKISKEQDQFSRSAQQFRGKVRNKLNLLKK